MFELQASVGGLPMSCSHSHEPVNCVRLFMFWVFPRTMHACFATPRFNQAGRSAIRWVATDHVGSSFLWPECCTANAVAHEPSHKRSACEPLALWSTLEDWYWSVSAGCPWLKFEGQQCLNSRTWQGMSHSPMLQDNVRIADAFFRRCTTHDTKQ